CPCDKGYPQFCSKHQFKPSADSDGKEDPDAQEARPIHDAQTQTATDRHSAANTRVPGERREGGAGVGQGDAPELQATEPNQVATTGEAKPAEQPNPRRSCDSCHACLFPRETTCPRCGGFNSAEPTQPAQKPAEPEFWRPAIGMRVRTIDSGWRGVVIEQDESS